MSDKEIWIITSSIASLAAPIIWSRHVGRSSNTNKLLNLHYPTWKELNGTEVEISSHDAKQLALGKYQFENIPIRYLKHNFNAKIRGHFLKHKSQIQSHTPQSQSQPQPQPCNCEPTSLFIQGCQCGGA